MLTPEQLNIYKARLETEMDVLDTRIAAAERPVEYNSEPGPEDEINEEQDTANQMSEAPGLRDRRGDVEAALLKIEKGTYGVCEKTGQDIPFEALDINPALRYHPEVMKEMNNEA